MVNFDNAGYNDIKTWPWLVPSLTNVACFSWKIFLGFVKYDEFIRIIVIKSKTIAEIFIFIWFSDTNFDWLNIWFFQIFFDALKRFIGFPKMTNVSSRKCLNIMKFFIYITLHRECMYLWVVFELLWSNERSNRVQVPSFWLIFIRKLKWFFLSLGSEKSITYIFRDFFRENLKRKSSHTEKLPFSD